MWLTLWWLIKSPADSNDWRRQYTQTCVDFSRLKMSTGTLVEAGRSNIASSNVQLCPWTRWTWAFPMPFCGSLHIGHMYWKCSVRWWSNSLHRRENVSEQKLHKPSNSFSLTDWTGGWPSWHMENDYSIGLRTGPHNALFKSRIYLFFIRRFRLFMRHSIILLIMVSF